MFFTNKINKILLTCFIYAVSTYSLALTEFEATYEVSLGIINLGDSEITLKKTKDNQYSLTLKAKTKSIFKVLFPYELSEQITLEETPSGYIRTLSYLYQESKKNKVQKKYDIAIDYNQMKAWRIKHKNPKTWKLITKKPLDRLSLAFTIGDEIIKGLEHRNPLIILDGRQARLTKLQKKQIQKNNIVYYKFKTESASLEIYLDKTQSYIPTLMNFHSDNETSTYYKLKKIKFIN